MLEGAYFEKGMPNFGMLLDEDDARAIHAYVVQQARKKFVAADQEL